MNEFTRLQRQWAQGTLQLAKSQGIPVRLLKAFRTAQILTYVLQLKDPTQLAKLGKLDEPLALALGVDSVRVGRYRGVVLVEVALPETYHQSIRLASLPAARGMAAALGESVLKQPIMLALDAPTSPHVLVAGTTGSGKTVLLQSWLCQLCRQNSPDNLRLLILDGKGDLRDFARLPHLLHPIADSPGDWLGVLSWTLAELDRRKHGQGSPCRLLVVVDELAEVIQSTGGTDGAAAEAIRRITALGRSLGIGMVVATQHPTANVLGGSVARANLPARAVGKVTDAAASSLATGLAGANAHRLRGKGDFLLVAGDEPARLQVALPSPQDLGELPRTGNVDVLDLEAISMDGAMAATAGPDARLVAYALATSWGVHKVRKHFSCGADRAAAAVRYSKQLRVELDSLGCQVTCKG